MAKKKQKMQKRQAKSVTYKPAYGAKEIKRILDEGNDAIANGSAPEDPWLFVAAAHALDLYDVAEDAKQGFKLDFTGQSSSGLLPAVMISTMMLTTQGKPQAEARQTVAKRFAAYMMFQVYNDLNEMGFEVVFDCSESSYALIAKTKQGEELRYDFLASATPVINRFMLGGASGGTFGGGTLQPFHQDLYEKFLLPLFSSAGLVGGSTEEV